MEARGATVVRLRQRPVAAPRIDPIDLAILASLQEDGRLSNIRLAEAVGLSPTPCLQRVRRLEALGLIEGYQANVDADRLGGVTTVFTEVTLRDRSSGGRAAFERYVRTASRITDCTVVGGHYDYLIRSLTRSLPDYQEMMERMLEAGLGILSYKSFPSLRDVKHTRVVPLELFGAPSPHREAVSS